MVASWKWIERPFGSNRRGCEVIPAECRLGRVGIARATFLGVSNGEESGYAAADPRSRAADSVATTCGP